ncbi:MAG: hypothetical protein ACLPPF_03135 [Rhodomicrobium sp.]
MDPDMVWQQRDAEREALDACSRRERVRGASSSDAQSAQRHAAASGARHAAISSLMVEAGGHPRPREARPVPNSWSSLPALLSRLLLRALPGALLWGGRSAAVLYWDLPSHMTSLAVAGASGFFSTLYGFASLFMGGLPPKHQRM